MPAVPPDPAAPAAPSAVDAPAETPAETPAESPAEAPVETRDDSPHPAAESAEALDGEQAAYGLDEDALAAVQAHDDRFLDRDEDPNYRRR